MFASALQRVGSRSLPNCFLQASATNFSLLPSRSLSIPLRRFSSNGGRVSSLLPTKSAAKLSFSTSLRRLLPRSRGAGATLLLASPLSLPVLSDSLAVGESFVNTSLQNNFSAFVPCEGLDEISTSFIRRVWWRLLLLVRGAFVFSFVMSLALSGIMVYFIPSIAIKKMWVNFLHFSLRNMGAGAVKLGQWAATRPDLFPPYLCDTLSDLHMSAPPHSPSASKEIIETAFGVPLEKLFIEFEQNPLASGAIAQVHRAKLVSGDVVAVKVRHPHVARTVKQDLQILKAFAGMSSWFSAIEWMGFKEAIDAFCIDMYNQVDMRMEARNLSLFTSNFAGFENISFPLPIAAKESVLIESFIDGCPVSNYIGKSKKLCEADKALAKKMASAGFLAYMKMVFVDNMIHADLHPGNIFVHEKGKDEVPDMIFLDAGLVAELSDFDRESMFALFGAIAAGDGKRGAELMIERARRQPDGQTLAMKARFADEVNSLFEELSAKPLAELEVGPYLLRLTRLCRECHVKFEGNFSTLITGMIVIEGLARQLNADFSLMDEALPLVRMEPELMNIYVKKRIRDLWSRVSSS